MTTQVSSPRHNVFGVLLSIGDYGAASIFIQCRTLEDAEQLRNALFTHGKSIIGL